MEEILETLHAQVQGIQGLKATQSLLLRQSNPTAIKHARLVEEQLLACITLVDALQARLEVAQSFVEQERQEIVKSAHLCAELDEQASVLEHVLANIPIALKERVLLERNSAASRKNSEASILRKSVPSAPTPAQDRVAKDVKGVKKAGVLSTSASVKPTKRKLEGSMQLAVELVTQDEFELLPHYLVGRLTLPKLNALIQEFNTLVKDKHDIISISPAKMNKLQRDLYWNHKKFGTDETIGLAWCSEQDIKSKETWSGSKLKYDPAGRSAIAIMRQLGRVKEVRGQGQTRLVIVKHAVHS